MSAQLGVDPGTGVGPDTEGATLPSQPLARGCDAPAGRPPDGAWLLRAGSRSVLVPVRPLLATGLIAVLLVAAAAVALAVGAAGVGPLRSLAAALGHGEAGDVLVVQQLRLPRLVAGLLVGAALGVSGLLMQVLARNRLATPGTVGIDDGATAFAVASVVGVSTSLAPSGAALIGAATAAALAFGLAGGTGTSGYRFLVVGLGVGAVMGAVSSLLLVRAPIDAANAAFPWAVGSLNARPSAPVVLLGVGLLVCLPLAVLVARSLAALRFCELVAGGLGVRVRAVRVSALGLSVVLAGLAVAVGGPLGLVALVAPEAARRTTGPRGVPVVASALAGALFVVLADALGRTVAAPVELPVGLVTALLGGPYLVWLLLSTRPRRTP